MSVQELALEAVAPARRSADRRRPGGRSRRSGRGSGACGRSPAAPRRGCRAGSVSSTSKWVRASRGPRPATAIRCAGAVVAADRGVDRPGARARRALDQGEVRRARPRAAGPAAAARGGPRRCARRPSARRCPCRGGGRSRGARVSPPPSDPAQPSTSVSPRCDGAGWTTSPAGLSTTSERSRRRGRRGSSPGRAASPPRLGSGRAEQDQTEDAER